MSETLPPEREKDEPEEAYSLRKARWESRNRDESQAEKDKDVGVDVLEKFKNVWGNQ